MGVTYVGSFVANGALGNGPVQTFTAAAAHVGDAILLQCGWGNGSAPSACAVTALGWTFTQLGTIQKPSQTYNGFPVYVAYFSAVAPDTSADTFTITWVGSGTGGNGLFVIGDNFTGNDTTGGSTTFDASSTASDSGVSDPSTSVTPANNNDGVWVCCSTWNNAESPGSGFTAANSAHGDNGSFHNYQTSMYQILSGGSGTPLTCNFTVSDTWAIGAVTIKPASGAALRLLPLTGVGR